MTKLKPMIAAIISALLALSMIIEPVARRPVLQLRYQHLGRADRDHAAAARQHDPARDRRLRDQPQARHDHRRDQRAPALFRAPRRPGRAVRHRRRPRRLPLVRPAPRHPQGRVAGLDPARRRCASASPTFRPICPAARTIRSAPAPSTSARRSIASTARRSPGPSARPFRRAASGSTNEDVIDLYDRVKVGDTVVVRL